MDDDIFHDWQDVCLDHLLKPFTINGFFVNTWINLYWRRNLAHLIVSQPESSWCPEKVSSNKEIATLIHVIEGKRVLRDYCKNSKANPRRGKKEISRKK